MSKLAFCEKSRDGENLQQDTLWFKYSYKENLVTWGGSASISNERRENCPLKECTDVDGKLRCGDYYVWSA